jgi:hypothetical protein
MFVAMWLKKYNMNKDVKYGVYAGIGLLVLGGLGYGAYTLISNNKNDETGEGEPKPKPDSFGIKVGDNLYPKETWVNVRSGAYVDDKTPTNLLYKHDSGLIGSVVDVTEGQEDKRTWYKVKLAKPIQPTWSNFWRGSTEGWVRSDVVVKG